MGFLKAIASMALGKAVETTAEVRALMPEYDKLTNMQLQAKYNALTIMADDRSADSRNKQMAIAAVFGKRDYELNDDGKFVPK